MSKIKDVSTRIFDIAESIRNRIYEEVSFLNETGRAVEMQNDFLKKHKINQDRINSALL
jgi:hypothetical protein